MKFNYIDYIFPSYSAPFISSYGIRLIFEGRTNLGIYNIDTVGMQARLIGLFCLFFSILLFYHLLIQIPKSIDKHRVREALVEFLFSPFFIAWICCVILKVFRVYFPHGTLLFISMIAICFYYQIKFNKKLLEIYNK